MNLVKNGNKRNGNFINKSKNANKPSNSPGKTLTNKVKEISDKAIGVATNLGEKITKTVTDIKQTVNDKIATTSEAVKGSSTTFEASKIMGQVQEFMNANSAISKFVAVVLSIIVFYMLFNLSMHAMSQYFMPTNHAKVVDGLVLSDKHKEVDANPNNSGSVPILRSVNQNQGLEFTWDVWFFINDVTLLDGYGLIFSKGETKYQGSTTTPTPSSKPNINGVCPGAYITTMNSNHVSMVVAISTYVDPRINNSGVETLTIPDIPLNKWVHCAIRVQNTSVDVYINGVMTQRKNLITLPNQNYGNTFIGALNGFKGYISSLNYYAYALNYDQIQSDFAKGPNMSLDGQDNKINYKDYLAMNWYYKSV